MYATYKGFILSNDIFDVLDWAEPIRNDDLESFVRLYEPSSKENTLFDPIEIAAAYDAEEVFNYLIEAYDYTDYVNAVDFSLLVVLLIFEREHFLLKTLETHFFNDEHLLDMYAYIVEHYEKEYFKQFYKLYPVSEESVKELFILSLSNYSIFLYLIDLNTMKPLLKDKTVIYEILSFHPGLTYLLEDTSDLTYFIDTDLFQNVVQHKHRDDFEFVLDFLLRRGWDVNTPNSFGLTPFHLALRFAKETEYVEILIEVGADTKQYTSGGYAPAHQLLFRDARFTLDLSPFIDFNAKDRHGYTLHDYDEMQRKDVVTYEEIISVVSVSLDMDASLFYELSEDEFYNLTMFFDVEVYTPYLTILSLKEANIKGDIEQALANMEIETYDSAGLKDMFPEAFDFNPSYVVQVGMDLFSIIHELLPEFQDIAKRYGTSFTLETEDYALNKTAHIRVHIDAEGEVRKEASVHSHLVDVYYIHQYFDVPIENITYEPIVKQSQRFLN